MEKQLLYSFEGMNTVITGASGEIGRVISEVFASQDSNVILIDLKEEEESLKKLAGKIIDEYGVNAEYYTADVSSTSSIEVLIKNMDKYQNIDILINNAGVNRIVPALKFSEDEWDKVVDINMKGTFLMSQGIAKFMIKNNKGIIINIASQHGEVGNVKRADYCASKAGIINMSRSLAIEWAKYNIRVNCVSPTFVIHDKNESYLKQPAVSKKLLKSIPLGSYCTPKDVADSVLFLASPMARLITGHNLLVDGGYTVQ